MAQSDSFKATEVNAKNTMALLKDQNIRQLPKNYTIWYEYLTESNPDLVRRVNELMASDGKFTDKIASEIYRDFFTFEKESKAIQETNRIVQKSMDTVMVNLNATTGEFANYGEQLSDFATKADGLSVNELQDVIGEIVSQTTTMSENAKNLNSSLSSASKEISDLRKLLAEVQTEALTDGLTGIANRRSFDSALVKATYFWLELMFIGQSQVLGFICAPKPKINSISLRIHQSRKEPNEVFIEIYLKKIFFFGYLI